MTQPVHEIHLPMGMPAHPGEEVTFTTYGWFAPWLWIIWGVVPAVLIGWLIGLTLGNPLYVIVGAIVGFLPALLLWWVRRHRQLVVTTDRVIFTTGIMTREQRVIHMRRVQDVGVRQGLAARTFGYGDLIFESAGETGQEAIPSLAHVRGARDAILHSVHLGEDLR